MILQKHSKRINSIKIHHNTIHDKYQLFDNKKIHNNFDNLADSVVGLVKYFLQNNSKFLNGSDLIVICNDTKKFSQVQTILKDIEPELKNNIFSFCVPSEKQFLTIGLIKCPK